MRFLLPTLASLTLGLFVIGSSAGQKPDPEKAKRIAEIEKEVGELQTKIDKLAAELGKLQPALAKVQPDPNVATTATPGTGKSTVDGIIQDVQGPSSQPTAIHVYNPWAKDYVIIYVGKDTEVFLADNRKALASDLRMGRSVKVYFEYIPLEGRVETTIGKRPEQLSTPLKPAGRASVVQIKDARD